MRLPVIRGVIERRILINFHVDPDVLARQLPAPFRPQLVHGQGMVGICLIRLKGIRLGFMPRWLGIGSENAAHRTAVEWEDNGQLRTGVFVRRRDTSSRLNAWAGGRVFPGEHHHARFTVEESADRFQVALQSDDRETHMSIRCERTDVWPESSVFESLAAASKFFSAGSLGYSTTTVANRYQGLELRCQNWQVEPLHVEQVQSSYFDDEALFPRGSIELDCALLMQQIDHEWHGRDDLCCAEDASELSVAPATGGWGIAKRCPS